MTEIALKIANQVIQLPEPRPRLVAGSVGVYAVTLAYDAQWDDATVRVVVFDGGLCNQRVPVQDTSGTVPIPPECIAHGGRGNWLQIGVLGYDGTGALRITTRAMLDGLRIDPAGASDADVPQEPPAATPGLWEKLVADVGNLSDLQTSDTSSLVAAINELAADATVDATLSVEGAAADAAAVGSAVKELARRDVASVYYFWNSHHTNDVVWAYNQGAPAVIAKSFDAGCPDGLEDAAPPCWVVFGNQSYGLVTLNITDARGMVWGGQLDLRDYSIVAVPLTQTLNLTGVKKGQIPRIASVSGTTAIPTEWEAADLPEADNTLGLTSATIGQTIKVKAVDTDGKPTAWEAVDMAGGETWVTLYNGTISIDQETQAVEVDIPRNDSAKMFEVYAHFAKNMAQEWDAGKRIDVKVNGADCGYFIFIDKLVSDFHVFAKREFDSVGRVEYITTNQKPNYNKMAMYVQLQNGAGYEQTNDGKISIYFAAPYVGSIELLVYGRY